MADLCTAFKRIVPRYQFSTNTATFAIEDMKDAPIHRKNGGFSFSGQPRQHGRKYRECNPYCSSMDTCGNWKSKIKR